MKSYNIPIAHVVNSDQIGVHLIPMAWEMTWESRGTKHVQVLGVEDKALVILVVSLVVNNVLLPNKIVFTSITPRCLPPSTKGEDKCMSSSWELTFSENHWCTLEITKQYVHKILLPYLHIQITQLKLQENKKMVWLLDCWSVHKNHEFLDWMK